MDPKAAYLEMLEASAGGDNFTAVDRALALMEWFSMGGFAPAGYNREAMIAHVLGIHADASSKMDN